ncbi:unnamed protein product, partial [marine sediment metagenome]
MPYCGDIKLAEIINEIPYAVLITGAALLGMYLAN